MIHWTQNKIVFDIYPTHFPTTSPQAYKRPKHNLENKKTNRLPVDGMQFVQCLSFILIVCFRLVTLITRRRLWISITTVWIVLIVYGLVTVFGSGLVLVDGVQWCEIALVGLSAQLSSLVTSVLFVDLPIAGLILFYGVICVKLRRSVKTHKQLQVRILQIS